jgi:hypothetical protein
MNMFSRRGYNKPINVFEPGKQRIIKAKYAGFDIETISKTGEFVCVSLYSDKEQRIFHDKNEFLERIFSNLYKGYIFIATNLQFDIGGTILKSRYEPCFYPIMSSSRMLMAFVYVNDDGTPYDPKHPRYEAADKTGRMKIARREVKFVDTMNYLQRSVEELGKLVGVPKADKPAFLGSWPKSLQEWQELETYCIRDAQVSKLTGDMLKSAQETLGGTMQMTAASNSKSLFRNEYLDKRYYIHSKDVLLEQFQGYYGGRSEVFIRGRGTKQLFYHDFNSMYPSVMHDEPYPDINSLHVVIGSEEKLSQYEGMSHVEIEIPKMRYPPLPVREGGKTIYPYGIFDGWYTHAELRYAITLGAHILKFHRMHYYTKTCSPFKRFIEDLYAKRLQYKAEGNAIMAEYTKLMMNSLYGKTGESFVGKKEVMNLTHFEADEVAQFNEIKNGYGFKTVDEEPKSHCVPIWAAHVTAYGRIKLHIMMNSVADSGHNVYYCDTDSVICDKEIENSKELGRLKIEYILDDYIFIAPKFYAFIGRDGDKQLEKCVLKGYPPARKMDFTAFLEMIRTPWKKKYTTVVKFKTHIRRELPMNAFLEQEKTFKLEDTKRYWIDAFDMKMTQGSFPWDIGDFRMYIHGEKAKMIHELKEKDILDAWINSNLFDKRSIGKDITAQEFIDNESDWKVR